MSVKKRAVHSFTVMRRILIILLGMICGCESATAPPDVYKYETLLPAGYSTNPTATYPLIFALHGAGGPGSINTTFRTVAARPQFGFIVVMPDAEDAGWITTS